MTDKAALVLLTDLAKAPAGSLWLADAATPDEVITVLGHRPDVFVVSNRFDVFQRLRAAGATARYSDFDLDWLGQGQVSAIFLRIAKEKALTHYLLNRSRWLLKPQGCLHLAGMRQEGIKGYVARARSLLGGPHQVQLQSGGLRSAAILRASVEPTTAELDDREYARLRPVAQDEGLVLYSKPGIFGWDTVDAGSAMLVQALRASGSEMPGSVLDLGCGYGYLAIHASRLGAGRVVATDSNAAALAACRRNFQVHDIAGDVIADDCAETLAGTFPMVLCNPPFHQGFKVEGRLTARFLGAARRLLSPRGQAWFVVNRFIALPRAASSLFDHCEVIVADKRFTVYRLMP